ncbi:hypothetical protein [Ligilactobacillus salivarius]|uniref:Uncharacterized protein n=1 Tax=Ligilactobacillus salivarius TaxID=1624 RepID=A0A2U2M201_9LACO|nr:hypothetical protein [Ligilactobacillus salivarius]PWG50776.1 hypothetical protein DB362_07980 [Ligilactobacillus salivarius]
MQGIQEPQQAAMPLIKVYLTDTQFEELKHILSTNISEDLVRAIVKEEIANDNLKAPYLKQKDFAQWIGESVATVNELRAKGLPVSYALGSVRYGKQSYIDFMKSRENLG